MARTAKQLGAARLALVHEAPKFPQNFVRSGFVESPGSVGRTGPDADVAELENTPSFREDVLCAGVELEVGRFDWDGDRR